MIEHTIKWDRSPFGAWCWHSFRGEGWEVTAEPYLYGKTADEPWGSYIIKTFRAGERVAAAVSPSMGAADAMALLLLLLGAEGAPLVVARSGVSEKGGYK